ncbi:DNA cytosine methyltransferase [Streptomyces sp. NRRL S-455]|uniref:DNA cytosine methyltransferase n=1 Tax=Streptomyces sp. NRRL S-455 TaxID=1463908 RepID=UPI00068FCCC9|nr:DNA cytosine methyltransferase [Streptomyces sp. NRRL S-455]
MTLHLFAGPGGMEAGDGSASIGIEYDDDAVATRRAAGLATVHGDVTDYGPADFSEDDTLAGGPPCQTFTVAGRGAGRLLLAHLQQKAKAMAARQALPPTPPGTDARSLLVLEPLRYVLAAADAGRPYRAVVLEQVPGALPVWQTYAEILRAEGYAAVCGVLNAEQYGVPQTRRRAVLLARRDGAVALPTPTHQKWSRGRVSGDEGLPAPVSMGEALDRPEPFTVVSNYGTGGDPQNRGQRASTEPAFTVTGKINRNRVVGPAGEELPRFTESEAGRLQGFPADYPWSGRGVPQQIGNACPTQLAAALFRAVRCE